ncbi:MAG: cell wall hydrolase [Clostridia bacterium]|nr:cell wall hydrolase [Clostridia bacterium]
MTTTKKRLFAIVLATLMLFSSLMLTSFARAPRQNLSGTKPIKDKNVNNYEHIPVNIAGSDLSDKALLINETTYVTLRSFSDALTDVRISYNGWNRRAEVVAEGLLLTATDGAYVVEANGRALFSMTPVVIMSNGKMYVPVRTLAKAYGVSVLWQNETRTVNIRGAFSPLESAETFYDKDELYWLSRIINAESRGEPMLGQIAVGNVVLNRVKHRDYPATIYGVIFDRKHGVQFSPVLDGSIYKEPTYSSTLSAKIVLEGFTLSERALFFLAPKIAQSNWIVNNRTYLFTVGNHDFYA